MASLFTLDPLPISFPILSFLLIFSRWLIFFEAQADNFDEIFGDNSKRVMHEPQLSGDLFSRVFGDGLVDLEVHVAVDHFVGVDQLIILHLVLFLLHHAFKN
jgi:hypothetical protein